MPKKQHREERSHKAILFAALAHSQLRYMAAMLAVLRVIEGHHVGKARSD